MTKLDLKKELKALYQPSTKEPVVVTVPPMHYLMMDGEGDPNTNPLYKEVVGTLYAVAYAIKFTMKKQMDTDFVVMPLEGLWYPVEGQMWDMEDRSGWRWTMMIAQPEMVTAELVERVAAETAKKKDLPRLGELRFEEYQEGESAQILHIGPYKDEVPTVARLHSFIEEQGYQMAGHHHEVYLSDPNRVAAAKMKTVIRYPVKRDA